MCFEGMLRTTSPKEEQEDVPTIPRIRARRSISMHVQIPIKSETLEESLTTSLDSWVSAIKSIAWRSVRAVLIRRTPHARGGSASNQSARLFWKQGRLRNLGTLMWTRQWHEPHRSVNRKISCGDASSARPARQPTQEQTEAPQPQPWRRLRNNSARPRDVVRVWR
jgi:hypothetical protein